MNFAGLPCAATIFAWPAAKMIGAAGANRVLTMDLHAGQIQGFFDIPVDHLFAAPVLLDEVRNRFNEKLVVALVENL